jgi:hypothetical protein
MKELIAAIYSIMYYVTRVKSLAYGLAIVYASALNVTILYGLSLLTKDLFPFAGPLSILFKLPYLAGTVLGVSALMFWLTPSRSVIGKEAKRIRKYTPLVVYTLLAVLVFVYSRYSDKIFS